MRYDRFLMLVGLLSAGPVLAQMPSGDAEFCQRYAAGAATVAQDAIGLNPACLEPGKGVHADRRSHAQWCARTPLQEVEGAATHIRRLASRCTKGALAEPNDYGLFDVAGRNERFEKPYGVARQWEVRAASSANTFMYCVAVLKRGDRHVRLGFDTNPFGEGQWQLAVPVPSNKDWEGALEVDGRSRSINGNAVPGWSIAWLGAMEVDDMRDGRDAILGVGKMDYDFSLEGVAAAMLKVEECRSRKGVLR